MALVRHPRDGASSSGTWTYEAALVAAFKGRATSGRLTLAGALDTKEPTGDEGTGVISAPETLKLGLGNWVSGPGQFFGYSDDIARFSELLQDGESIALTAPRRAGKTSLMREVGRNLPSDTFYCLHLDLEAASGPSGFFRELERAGRELEPFQQRLVDFLAQIAGPLGELHSEAFALRFVRLFEEQWQARAERLFTHLATLPRRSVFFIDEVPLFLNRLLESDAGRSEVESFLHLLRSAAQRHRHRVQFVLTGSNGLIPLLQRLGLSSAINHYVNYDLRPWDHPTICKCVRALATHYRLPVDPRAEHRIAELLGVGIPYHVQIFFSELREHARRRHLIGILPDDVDAVYRERLLGPQGARHLSHLRERLTSSFPEPTEYHGAISLLVAATDPAPLTWPAVVQIAREAGLSGRDIHRVVEILIHDGYLDRDAEERIRFVPGYLRDWWRQQYAMADAPGGDAHD